METFKDAWKFFKDYWFNQKKFLQGKTELKYEEQNRLTRFFICAMDISLFIVMFVLLHLGFKSVLGVDMQIENIGFMWFLDWHCISFFILIMAIILYVGGNPHSSVCPKKATFISGLCGWLFVIAIAGFIYLEWGDNKYAKQHIIDVSPNATMPITISNYNYHNSVWHIFDKFDIDLINSTLGEVYCYYKKYNDNICKDYVYYVENLKESTKIERERKQAEIEEKHKLELNSKQEELQEAQSKQNEIEQNLKSVILDYKRETKSLVILVER